ncbi:MAG: formylglycine-generating enzyme family protein [Elainellaceae cyanobacterium]
MSRWAAGLVLLLLGCSRPSPEAIAAREQRCEVDETYVWVEAGDYVAGSDAAERDYAYRISAEAVGRDADSIAQAERQLRQRGWFDDEPGQKTASLPGFCLGKFLVTNQDYQAFVQATGHRVPGISEAEYQEQGFLVHPYADILPFLWRESFPEGQVNYPVVLVSYDDALAYAGWLSDRDGVAYRLPTASEWEKAARGTEGGYFPWGDEWRAEATNWGQREGGTTPVGAFPDDGPYGTADMAGNVFEYTATLRGGRSVMKGCSWDDLPGFCRAAYRHTRPTASRHILFGFRLVKGG